MSSGKAEGCPTNCASAAAEARRENCQNANDLARRRRSCCMRMLGAVGNLFQAQNQSHECKSRVDKQVKCCRTSPIAALSDYSANHSKCRRAGTAVPDLESIVPHPSAENRSESGESAARIVGPRPAYFSSGYALNQPPDVMATAPTRA